jgi:hypothetical protein
MPMRLPFPLVRLESSTLAAFLGGTILTILLLAAQSGRNPLQAAAWILISTALTMVTRGYQQFVSTHEEQGGGSYVAGLARKVGAAWPIVAASLPTVLLLVLAAVFGWPDDREDPGGKVTIGYTTIVANLNVLLLFFWGAVSAGRSGLSRPWTVLVGFANAALGLLVVSANLALKK